MVYKRKNGTNEYRVFTDSGDEVGAFAYHVEKNPAGFDRFWIDGISLASAFCEPSTMEAVMLFIQYKCERCGTPAMHLRLDEKNILYMDLCRRFGFYAIDEEIVSGGHGQVDSVCVLKYTLPTSREEMRHEHILRQQGRTN